MHVHETYSRTRYLFTFTWLMHVYTTLFLHLNAFKCVYLQIWVLKLKFDMRHAHMDLSMSECALTGMQRALVHVHLWLKYTCTQKCIRAAQRSRLGRWSPWKHNLVLYIHIYTCDVHINIHIYIHMCMKTQPCTVHTHIHIWCAY